MKYLIKNTMNPEAEEYFSTEGNGMTYLKDAHAYELETAERLINYLLESNRHILELVEAAPIEVEAAPIEVEAAPIEVESQKYLIKNIESPKKANYFGEHGQGLTSKKNACAYNESKAEEKIRMFPGTLIMKKDKRKNKK